MKYAVLFCLSAALVMAGDFVTGQAARLVIGQSTFTAADPGASATLLGGVSGLAYANNMLMVADSNRVGSTPINNRVLIYKNLTSQLPALDASIPPNLSRCPICVGSADVVLGQRDFTSTDPAIAQNGMRTPTGVATNGTMLAVADTDNNRVLIWNSIPQSVDQPADIVLGQKAFDSIQQPIVVTASSFRGPQGVWIQGDRFFVADTQNNRVMIWNHIPTQNNQPADIVLGQKDFTTVVNPDLTQAQPPAANTLQDPVSVTSDGQRLYVTDLGNARVLVWNSIPAQNQQPADVVIGQPDMTTGLDQNVVALCPSSGTDANGNNFYPAMCGKTLSYPRFALSDGQRLFIADGGNDRILIFNSIPTSNAPEADIVLGQRDEYSNQNTDYSDIFNPNLEISSSNSIRTPMSLAWDGSNLYASDPFDRRVVVYTIAEPLVPINAVLNAASLQVYAGATVALSGTIQADDIIEVLINCTDYRYTVKSDDTTDTVMNGLVNLINANGGDPNVLATPDVVTSTVVLTARKGGPDGNNVKLSATTYAKNCAPTADDAKTACTNGTTPTTSTSSSCTTSPGVAATASGANLSGGQDAGTIAPGTLVTMFGTNLSDQTLTADLTQPALPFELGGVQVYFDGNRAPIVAVSPTQVTAQFPFEFLDTTSSSSYIRTVHSDGTVTVTSAVNIPVAQQNPGIFANPGEDPRAAVALHSSNYATGTVSVDGSINAGDVGTVTVGDATYTYTVQSSDTLASVRDAFIALINANENSPVTASAAAAFTRIRLRAKQPGPIGDGIAITGNVTAGTSSGSSSTGPDLLLTATNSVLCCANQAGALVTRDNPAVPGETIIVYATGLGLVGPEEAKQAIVDGAQYTGTPQNDPVEFVSGTIGGKTANVISAGLKPGTVGIYEVQLELNSSLPTDPLTQCTIAQSIYVSNPVTIPIYNPNPSTVSTGN